MWMPEMCGPDFLNGQRQQSAQKAACRHQLRLVT